MFLLVYFTASHWFFHRFFFHQLGIDEASLDSPFVISQLQLIGAMVLGYAVVLWRIAGHPEGPNHEVLNSIMAVGAVCSVIFIGSVATGRLPLPFLLNAALLLALNVAVLVTRRRPADVVTQPER